MRNEGGDEDGEDGDEDKHDDKDGDVCKDLEQGHPGVLELLGYGFASMVPLSKSVDCPLFFFFVCVFIIHINVLCSSSFWLYPT